MEYSAGMEYLKEIELVLKDGDFMTELQTIAAVQNIAERYDVVNAGSIRSKKAKYNGVEHTRIAYMGRLCSSHDLPILFGLDKSGALESNVAAVYDRTTKTRYEVADIMAPKNPQA